MAVCPKCGDKNPQLGAMCPRDGHYYVYESALKDAESDPRIGTRAAEKYVILGRISKGGMGAVYRALQLPVEREVAFKVLRTELQDSDQGRDRFIREARAVSRLTHPNIITLHDFGFETNGQPYMVMEYAPGKSLSGWIYREKNVTLERIVHIAIQLLSALGDAHQQGIIHRDLKPENVIITQAGGDRDYVKLLDFGIARVINESATRGLTREGEVFGTPHYMAPEQAQGSKELGPAADIYAVGIMLYEMICKTCPFDSDQPLTVLLMHLNEPFPPLAPRDGLEVPESVQHIVQRATAKDPGDRFTSSEEMRQALLEALYGASHHSGLRNASHYITPVGLRNAPSSASSLGGLDAPPAVRLREGSATHKESGQLPHAQQTPFPASGGYGVQTPNGIETQPHVNAQPFGPSHTEQVIKSVSSRRRNLVAALAVFLVLIVTGSVTIYALINAPKEVVDHDPTIEAGVAPINEPTTTPLAPAEPASTSKPSLSAPKKADAQGPSELLNAPLPSLPPESAGAPSIQDDKTSEQVQQKNTTPPAREQNEKTKVSSAPKESNSTGRDSLAESPPKAPTPRPRPPSSKLDTSSETEPEEDEVAPPKPTKFEPRKFAPPKPNPPSGPAKWKPLNP